MFNDMILVFKPPGKPLISLLTMCYKFLNTLIDFQKPCYGNWRTFIQYLIIYLENTFIFSNFAQWLIFLKLTVGGKTTFLQYESLIFVVLAFLVAQTVKNPAVMQEIWVWSLGREDPLEKGIPSPYSCLEKPIDRGAWQPTVHGFAKRWTRLSN